jgi:DNA polymerase-3 subunit alpha
MSSKGFTHLHLHSQYSLLDGAIAFDKLLKRCKKLKMDTIAVTDHGNMFGAVEFYTKAIAAHIKPILGIEAYIAPRSRFEVPVSPRDFTIARELIRKSLPNLMKA